MSLRNAFLILSGHDNSRCLRGYHRIQSLIDAGDAIEMGFEETGDRGGVINQGAGRPVNGEKNSDILEHAELLSGYKSLTSLPVIMPAHARDALIYLMRRSDLQNVLERLE
jgi:hypothetical protein